MLKRIVFLAALSTLAVLIGCNSGGASIYFIQGFNVLSDGPPLSFRQNGLTISNGLPYGTSSGFLPGTIVGSKRIEIQPVLADLSLGDPLIDTNVDVSKDVETSLIVAGNFDDPELIVVTTDRRKRPISEIFFQFVHAVNAQDALDVYVAAPDVDLSTTAPFATIEKFDYSTSMLVPFGEYVISVTPAGNPGQVLYVSDLLTFVDIPEIDFDGVEWLVAIADNFSIGDSSLRLLVSSENGGFALDAAGTGAALRITNASPDAPALDTFLDEDFSAPLTNNTGYADRSPVTPIPAAVATVSVTATGTVDPILHEYDREYLQSTVFDSILVRDVAEMTNLTFGGNPRSVVTDGKMRFANASTAASVVSVYLADSGTSDLDEDDLIVRDLPFPASTDYLRLLPGEYSLIITERSTTENETVIIGPIPYEFLGGEVQTGLIILPESGGDEEVLMVYDDLLP